MLKCHTYTTSLVPIVLNGNVEKVKDKKERNKQIVKAYEKGYSQHTIAKVVGISQQAVYGVIKRYRGKVVIITRLLKF